MRRNTADAYRMHPRTLNFEHGVEDEYRLERVRHLLPQMRRATLLLVLFGLVGAPLLEWATASAFVWITRSAMGAYVALTLAALGCTYTGWFVTRHGLRNATVAAVGVAGVGTLTLVLATIAPAEVKLMGYAVAVYAVFVFWGMEALSLAARGAAAVSYAVLAVGALSLAIDEAPIIEIGGAVLVAQALAYGAYMGRTGELYARRDFAQRRLLDAERSRSEHLLLNILPAPIAARLKAHEGTIADSFSEATVLFADMVGFTEMSARLTPEALVGRLDRVFSAFDALTERRGLEKIKTIGDAYMVVGGLPEVRADHVEAVVELGLDMLREAEHAGEGLRVRIGINTGPVVAGVIGTKKFAYDLWGDTVNTAARMEAYGVPARIHCTAAVYERLKERYCFEEREEIEVKGKGWMRTYLVMGRRAAAGTAAGASGGPTGLQDAPACAADRGASAVARPLPAGISLG